MDLVCVLSLVAQFLNHLLAVCNDWHRILALSFSMSCHS